MKNKLLVIITLAALLLALFCITSVQAKDMDEDGLDDDWEAANNYDNKTKDKWVDKRSDDVDKYQEEIFPTFLFVLIGSFGVFSLILGAFTTRFAAGRSRVTGAIMLGTGILIGVVFLLFSILELLEYPNDTLIPGGAGFIHWQVQLVLMPFFTIMAFGIGAFLALLFFLVVIMKA